MVSLRVANEAPAPLAAPNYDYRRRPNERLNEVPVTAVRAVMGTPEQRCWVERQPSADAGRPDINVPGAVIGGVLGGILGHQIGSGSGKTIATIGGALGGGALGANVDRIRDRASGQEIRRCENVADQTPQYWDVTYVYQGREHHAQMSTPPGRTILVNRDAFPVRDTVYVASGMEFPDALAGAAVAGATHSPLYLIPSTCLYTVMLQEMVDLGTKRMVILGGTGIIGSNIPAWVNCN